MEASATSEGRQREWVLIVMSWDSRFGDLSWRLGKRPDDRKTGGDAVGGFGDCDDADLEKGPTRVGLRLIAFGSG